MGTGITSGAITVGAPLTTGTITIGGTAETGTITLGSSTGANTVNVGTGSGATAVNIGTAGSGSVTTIGNANGASGVKLNWGTGNFILTPLSGTAGALVLSNAGVVSEASGTSGYVLTSTGATTAPTFQAPAASSISITGNTGGAFTGNAFTFTGGATGLTFNGAGTTETLGGTLVVANGGTGLSTLTAHSVLLGEGTLNVGFAVPGATGIPLISSGASTDPVFGTATVPGGGTGATTFTAYAPLIGNGTGALQTASSGQSNSGYVLTSTGSLSAPTWQSMSGIGAVTSVVAGNNISITGTATSPVVNVAGTTPYAVQIGNATNSALTSVTPGTNGQVLLGATGAAPAFASLSSSSGTLAFTPGMNSLGIDVYAPLSIAYGGTNATLMANTDGVVYYDGTKLNTTAVGTDGYVLTSNGAGNAPSFQSLPAASSANDPNALVLRDGSGDFATNMITIAGTPSAGDDVATVAYVQSLITTGIVIHSPAVLVGTVDEPITGPAMIDGSPVFSGERILLVDQTTSTQNGLWLAAVGAGSPWSRPADFANGSEAGLAYVLITGGNSYAGSSWLCSTPTAIIGTSPIAFQEFSLPNQVQGANLGAGGGLVYAGKSGITLNFNTITGDNYITVATSNNEVTITSDATPNNTASTIVARNASGNFSAGTITATNFIDTGIAAHTVVVGEGTGALIGVGPGTAGQVLISGGSSADPSYVAPSVGTGLTILSNATTLQYGLSIPVAVSSGGTGQTSITGVLVGSGSAITGNPVTQYDVLVGGASNAITSITPSTAGYVLTSNGTGTNPTFQSPASSSISITGNTGGTQTGDAFTFTGAGSSSGLYFAGAADTFTTSFQGATINAGAVNIGTDSATNAINIGTVTSTGRVTTIGNTTGASGIAEAVGTGNYVLSGATSSNITVGTGITTGAITVGAPLTTGTITIGGTAETGTITLGSSTGANTVNVGTGSGATAVNIGTAGSGSVTTIGNATGASGVKLNWGTGNFILTPLSGTAGALVLSNAGVVSEASGTSGYVLTSTGATTAPTFQAPAASSISITGDNGGAQTGDAFTFTGAGSSSGLYFTGAADTFTTSFQGAVLSMPAPSISEQIPPQMRLISVL